MRLIDADALILAAQQDGAFGYVSAKEIADAPTIDAEPVRHGKWTHERLVSTSGGTYAVVRCSECQWQHPMWKTKFCPNCGAQMDEAEP